MYYEYFRERAAACRRSAEEAEGWLSDVSSQMANMYEELAEDSLTRELTQLYKPRRPVVPKILSHAQWKVGMLEGPDSLWRRMLYWASEMSAALHRVMAKYVPTRNGNAPKSSAEEISCLMEEMDRTARKVMHG